MHYEAIHAPPLFIFTYACALCYDSRPHDRNISAATWNAEPRFQTRFTFPLHLSTFSHHGILIPVQATTEENMLA